MGFGGDGVGEEGWGDGVVEERGERRRGKERGDGNEVVVIVEERGRGKDGGEMGGKCRVRSGSVGSSSISWSSTNDVSSMV